MQKKQFIKVDHRTATAVIKSQLKIQDQTFSKTCENELYITIALHYFSILRILCYEIYKEEYII